ncbi:MAG: antibiotic biosynthesis monooxygenase [Pseudomonadota bacterium]
MFCNFLFYAHAADAGFAKTTLQRSKLAVVASTKDFDREGYSKPDYEAIVIDRYDDPLEQEIADLSFRAWTIRRGKGQKMDKTRPSVILTTLCAIEPDDQKQFLCQFDQALEFVQGQSGFLGSLLFRGDNEPGRSRWLVNVARWQNRKSFLSTFTSPKFRQIVGGTFRWSSQVIIAEFPAVKN